MRISRLDYSSRRKPANILVTSNGVPEIADFGIAKPWIRAELDGGLTALIPLTPTTPVPNK